MDIQGLFPITSIINHSCTANTICFATDGYKFTCKAVTDIQVGELPSGGETASRI